MTVTDKSRPGAAEVGADVFEATAAGLRIAELAVVILTGLLLAPVGARVGVTVGGSWPRG